MASTKRIAVCLSGQPRTWEKCYQTWFDLIGHLGQVDFFCHLWDYNSLTTLAQHELQLPPSDVVISEDEKQRIIDALKPKKIIFQSKNDNVFVCQKYVKNPIAPWSQSQFYSHAKAAFLKRQYEIENDFEYDLVFRMRADLHFTSVLHPPVIEPNTFYSVHNTFDTEVNKYRVGDIFYFCDSFTYDQAAGFYESFNFIDASVAVPGFTTYPPELALYFFLASKGIRNTHPPVIDFKIMRSEEHLQRVGVLQPYETT